MSATPYTFGKGATFSISINGGTTWILVKRSKTINYNGQKTNFDDITNMDSPSAYLEFAPTTNDPGTAQLQGVHDPVDPGQLAVRAAQVAQTPIMCKHQFPLASDQTTTGMLRTFNAFAESVGGPDSQFDKASNFNFTFKISGPITDTPGT